MSIINVNKYRSDIIDNYNLDTSAKFMDELSKWDQTVSQNQLYSMYYDEKFLDSLLNDVLNEEI